MAVKQILIMMLLLSGAHSEAKDLGVSGTTYTIQEEHALHLIQQRLQDPRVQTAFKSLQQQMIHKAQQKSIQPKKVENITRATQTRSFYFEPSVVLENDIRSPEGTLLAAKGSVLNPLKFAPLQQSLLFLDTSDKIQQEWLLKSKKNFQQHKVILIGGAPQELMKVLGKQVYFDQSGRLVQRLKIQHVPAMVQQEGERLVVKELAL